MRITAETFQYLGSRGAQLGVSAVITSGISFNTWAREEPNTASTIHLFSCTRFQYLGSRGAQRSFPQYALISIPFQYLGSRGAQLVRFTVKPLLYRFNTWAREEPNSSKTTPAANDVLFQYLGSRGAQLGVSAVITSGISFNTWAREEPNSISRLPCALRLVSILGLARSPTEQCGQGIDQHRFQYLGSRGAQLQSGRYRHIRFGFNTWAREEPNCRGVSNR